MRSISNIDFFCNNNFVAARFLIENNNNEKKFTLWFICLDIAWMDAYIMML